jgi:nickel transport protein
MRKTSLVLLVLAALVLWPEAAWAHKLNVFAWVEGRRIVGEAYFRGHAPLVGGAVTVFGPGDQQLGQTKTDAQGKFQFEVQQRVDHRLLVDTGDGHAESFTVRAAELPADLPGGTAPAAKPAATPAPPAKAVSDSPTAVVGLQAQIGQLRAELQEFKHEVRLRDVLGGLGYICGLMGVAFYFLGVRKNDR